MMVRTRSSTLPPVGGFLAIFATSVVIFWKTCYLLGSCELCGMFETTFHLSLKYVTVSIFDRKNTVSNRKSGF